MIKYTIEPFNDNEGRQHRVDGRANGLENKDYGFILSLKGFIVNRGHGAIIIFVQSQDELESLLTN